MPSVEYPDQTLVWTEETKKLTHPETGETVTKTIEHPKYPFALRISKWKPTSDGAYQLHGFVEVTDFGNKLASQSNPYEWLTNTYQTDSMVTSSVVAEWVQGFSEIKNGQLDAILSFGNVFPASATIDDVSDGRLTFMIELNGATTFDIEWLRVDFDPSRSNE
jgi:hypothetical protein